MKTTGSPSSMPRIAESSCNPLMPGICRSVTTASGRFAVIFSIAASPPDAVVTV